MTAAFLTSGLLDVLAEQDPGALAGLRLLATGGDVVSPDRGAGPRPAPGTEGRPPLRPCREHHLLPRPRTAARPP
ncbi:hypothetical protein NQP46_31715 [Streptomyces albus]|nr:hypothetical protein NQP46_31715 [Streptomyces albus]